LHDPVFDKNWPFDRPEKMSGLVKTFMPPVKTVSQSPALKDVQAKLIAAKLLEHAVSMLKDGPLNPKW